MAVKSIFSSFRTLLLKPDLMIGAEMLANEERLDSLLIESSGINEPERSLC
jgi:G3E family GTPase